MMRLDNEQQSLYETYLKVLIVEIWLVKYRIIYNN